MADLLRSLGPGIWSLDQEFATGGLALGLRTLVLRLADGAVLVHAPGPSVAAARGEIERIGPVRALIAPNLLHHFFLGDAAGLFPAARVFAAPGLRAKRPELRVDEELGEKPPELWARELEQIAIGGAPGLGETVFVHRASRTLVCLDLCFHVRPPKPFATRAFMRLNGAWDRFGPSRLFRYAIVKDRRALRASLERVLACDFDRVTVAHGDVLERGGHDALRQGFAWLR